MQAKPRRAQPVRTEVQLLLRSAQAGGEVDNYPGKRNSVRFTEALQLEVTKDPARPIGTMASTLHNVSEGGCSFWLRQKLDRNSQIFVREFNGDSSLPWILAYVTHCTMGVQGYLVGVRFDENQS